LIHAFNCAQVERIGGKPVKSVCRHAEHFAGTDLVGSVADERRLRFFAADLDHFDAHENSRKEPSYIVFARVKDNMITRLPPSKAYDFSSGVMGCRRPGAPKLTACDALKAGTIRS